MTFRLLNASLHQAGSLTALSSAEVSFAFPVGWGIRKGEIKRAGGGERGIPSSPARPRFFNFSLFSLFPRFLAIFPLEGASEEERGSTGSPSLFAAFSSEVRCCTGLLLLCSVCLQRTTRRQEFGIHHRFFSGG